MVGASALTVIEIIEFLIFLLWEALVRPKVINDSNTQEKDAPNTKSKKHQQSEEHSSNTEGNDTVFGMQY